jgi:hypothetical protein
MGLADGNRFQEMRKQCTNFYGGLNISCAECRVNVCLFNTSLVMM